MLGPALRLAAAAATAAAALVLAGCTGPVLVEGSEVRVGVPDPLTTLNAGTGGSTATDADAASLLSSGFGWYDDAGQFVADESFGRTELVAEDPLTVRYSLSGDARWSDGTPIDAADLLLAWVADSGARDEPDFDDAPFIDAETGRYTADFPRDAVWFDGAVGSGLEQAVQDPVVEQDGRALVVHFDRAVPGWPLLLRPAVPAHVLASLALDAPLDGGEDAAAAKTLVADAVLEDDREALAALSRAWNSAYSLGDAMPEDERLTVSSGPYRLAELDGEGGAVLEASPEYRGVRRPLVERIALRVVADPQSAVDAVEAGELDLAPLGGEADDVEAAASLEEGSGARVVASPSASFEHLDLQLEGSRSGAFGDERVRRAFLLTVPRAELAALQALGVGDEAPVLDSFALRSGDPAYEAAADSAGAAGYASPDPAAARALLAEAGATAPEVCLLFDPAQPRRSAGFELIRDAAAEAGFRVTSCASREWSELLGVPGAYDAALFAWDTSRLGPAAVSAVYRSDSRRANLTGFADARVDAAAEELPLADPARQAELLGEIDERVWASASSLPIAEQRVLTAIGPRVDGVTRSPLARGVFWNAWMWAPSGDDGQSG
ncbi:ABC transporter substrate-binding protein [Homoserinibacter sp. YIM 151385]|uniref:ABC transporter substrate-binding protein n=1 Tax=Homoserinibacter sp. YIM 151385 TaxID=2985506 RepID=UPI0022F02C46|nr:ABC transporter substrate-binding protein [Homoserinibacter sp. YIM 151385]WBU38120.1 ABC transporter substrate-binding protein [Homoserinibacter sp. YIM 151385]